MHSVDVIYTKRRHALFGERLSIDIANTMHDVGSVIVNEFLDVKDFEGFKLELIREWFSIDSPVTEDEFFRLSADEMAEKVFETVQQSYKRQE